VTDLIALGFNPGLKKTSSPVLAGKMEILASLSRQNPIQVGDAKSSQSINLLPI